MATQVFDIDEQPSPSSRSHVGSVFWVPSHGAPAVITAALQAPFTVFDEPTHDRPAAHGLPASHGASATANAVQTDVLLGQVRSVPHSAVDWQGEPATGFGWQVPHVSVAEIRQKALAHCALAPQAALVAPMPAGD